METYLFYAYLKYSKENNQSFWPKLTSYPASIIIFVILIFLSGFFSIVFSLLKWYIASMVGIAFEITFVIIFYYIFEKYRIDFSSAEYKDYRNYCLKLYDWIKEFDISTVEKVEDLYHNVVAKKQQLELEEETKNSRGERWLQTLIIPVIIAIITTASSRQANMGEMILSTFLIISIFILIYGTVSATKSIINFPQKRKIKQMECFATDLNALLSIIKQ